MNDGAPIRRGRGRPTIGPSERRTRGVLVRLTPREHAEVSARADEETRRTGRFVSVAALLRRALDRLLGERAL